MKLNLKRSALLLTGILACGKLFAQTPDTTKMQSDYVQPFSHDAFRTWSIGLNGGLLTPYTVLGMKEQDFKSPHEQFGYSGYIKDQILPSFGIQADYLGGKVAGSVTEFDQTSGTYSSFSTKINYAVDLSVNFTLANINWRHEQSFI